MTPVKGTVVEAGPGGADSGETLSLAQELGYGCCQGLQEGFRRSIA